MVKFNTHELYEKAIKKLVDSGLCLNEFDKKIVQFVVIGTAFEIEKQLNEGENKQ